MDLPLLKNDITRTSTIWSWSRSVKF